MGDAAARIFDSVWDELEETPEAQMRLRSALAIAVREVVDSRGVSQTEAARRLGVTHPRLNDLLRARGSVQFGGVDWAGGAGWWFAWRFRRWRLDRSDGKRVALIEGAMPKRIAPYACWTQSHHHCPQS
jgi:predicted XRE-type DNA-binding protein